MPPDTSPPVGNSYFWESQRINHISYSRRWRAFSWRGTGSEWGRFHFRVVVLHMLRAASTQCVSRAGHRALGTAAWALLPHTSPRGRICGAGC